MSETAPPKKKRSYKKWIIAFWLLFLLGIGSVVSAVWAIKAGLIGEPMPPIEKLENPKSNLASEIYTADGELLGKYFRQNRSRIDFEDISPYMFQALVSTEDERYYEHSGIDAKGLARAIAYLGKKGGASTVTQQLAKMLFHERSRSKIQRIIQKVQEWVIAVELEKRYTKEEILTMYLNEFDYLYNAVGIKSAARVYFNKQPIDLRIEEAAVFVGMFKNPILYNPRRFPEKALVRRNTVLGQMERNGVITTAEKDSLTALPIELDYQKVDHKEGAAPYFRAFLNKKLLHLFREKDENGNYVLHKPDGEPYDIYEDGLRIYTTLNSKMQAYAEWAMAKHIGGELQEDFFHDLAKKKYRPFDFRVSKKERDAIIMTAINSSERYNYFRRNGMSRDSCLAQFDIPTPMKVFSWKGEIDTVMTPRDSILYYKSFLHSGMMSMNPHSGEIKAWVGGIDFNHFQYDHVYQGKRQVGSTFKPLIYALAVQEGYSPCYEVPNVPVVFEKDIYHLEEDWSPKNADGEYGGMMTLKCGLANSVNTITAWIMKQFGPQAVVDLGKEMGITSHLAPVPSLCLGVADLSLYEILAANATFVNQGVWVEPVYLTRIEDKNGSVIARFRPKTNEVFSEETAFAMIQLMQGVTNGAYNSHTGKTTGSGMRIRYGSSGSRAEYGQIKSQIAAKTGTTQHQSDGWYIGMTPNLVTGIWTGAEDRGVRFSRLYYGQGANMALPIWGYYMKKIYKDGTLGVTELDEFQKPDADYDVDMDCRKRSKQDPEPGGEDYFHDGYNDAVMDDFSGGG